jgi:amidophosphoribosyltransferase
VDTPTRNELIAATHSLDEINQYITSDTLAYLSLNSLTNAVMTAKATRESSESASDSKRHLPVSRGLSHDTFCHACWSGEYPIPFTPFERKEQLPLLHL